MTNDPDFGTRPSFTGAFDDEPPMGINLAAVTRHGATRLRRRRTAAVGGAVLAVALVTAGVAVGAPHISESGPASGGQPSVPGCTKVVATDDMAVILWRNGGTTPSSTPVPSGAGIVPGGTYVSAASSAAESGPADAGPPIPAWFTAAKAGSMTAALRRALPKGAVLKSDPPSVGGNLPFVANQGPSGGGLLTVGSSSAELSIQVESDWPYGPPPCTANLALRVVGADGGVTDVTDDPGTPETGRYMTAESFRPDGTLIIVGLNNGRPDSVPPATVLPLTVRQLATIAALPELAVSAK